MTDVLGQIEKLGKYYALGGASPDAVAEAEQALQLTFAPDYRDYTLAHGAISYRSHELTGICASSRLNVVAVTKQEREIDSSIPLTWYVLENIGIDGAIVWQSSTGKVYQTVPGRDPVQIGESLAEYIAGE